MFYKCPICRRTWGESDAYISSHEEGESIDTALVTCCDFCEEQQNVDLKFKEDLLNVLREISKSLNILVNTNRCEL